MVLVSMAKNKITLTMECQCSFPAGLDCSTSEFSKFTFLLRLAARGRGFRVQGLVWCP